MAVAFGSNPVQSGLLFRTRSIPNIAVIMLSWGLKWPPKVIGLPFSAMESSAMREILAVRKLLQSFAPKPAGLCFKGTQTTRTLRVLLTSAIRSVICKRRLSAFLRFAFFIEFLSNLNGCPDPGMSRRISRIVDFDDWFVRLRIFLF